MNHDTLLEEMDRIKDQENVMHQAEEKRRQEQQNEILNKAKAVSEAEHFQQIVLLELDINTREKSLAAKSQKLLSPKIIIQDQVTRSIKEEWATLDTLVKKHENIKVFSPFLLQFGSKIFAFISLLFIQAIGIYYVWAELGLDAAGGVWQTLLIAVLLLFTIDVIGMFAVTGCLTSMELFLNGKRYRRMLEGVMTFGFSVGFISFVCNAILRVMEAKL